MSSSVMTLAKEPLSEDEPGKGTALRLRGRCRDVARGRRRHLRDTRTTRQSSTASDILPEAFHTPQTAGANGRRRPDAQHMRNRGSGAESNKAIVGDGAQVRGRKSSEPCADGRRRRCNRTLRDEQREKELYYSIAKARGRLSRMPKQTRLRGRHRRCSTPARAPRPSYARVCMQLHMPRH